MDNRSLTRNRLSQTSWERHRGRPSIPGHMPDSPSAGGSGYVPTLLAGGRLSIPRFLRSAATVLSIAALVVACSRSPEAMPATTQPRTDELAVHPVRIQVIADPAQPQLDRDLLLTLRFSAPSTFRIVLPELGVFDDRLQGFAIEGRFDREPQTRDGQTILERCLRLRPLPGVEHRLAPFAVGLARTKGTTPPSEWIATRPVVYEAAPLTDHPSDARVGSLRGPIWIRPSLQTVALGLLVLFLLTGASVLAWKFFRRVRREMALRKLSPRDRALFELNELLQRGWIEGDRIKDFYFELTMIVRCYIERAHTIRAPEQTTEEFLEAVSRDARFDRETIRRLRAFLQAADLVKYAARRPDAQGIAESTQTARDYIEHDSMSTDPGGSHVPVR